MLKVVEEIQAIGQKHGASAGQATLAWLLAQGPDVIPIPGTRNVKVKRENLPIARREDLTMCTSSILTKTLAR